MPATPELCKILIAEDDPDLSYLLRQVLLALGFRNLTVTMSGRAALDRALGNQQFDLILTDWEMKPMSGIEFVRNLRQLAAPANRYAPVIMLTGRTSREDVKRARDVGITEFLAKPFAASDLLKRIQSVVKNPRQFVIADQYSGPDRRRKTAAPPDGRKKRLEDRT